jgi:HK97 gp10 family phage protein
MANFNTVGLEEVEKLFLKQSAIATKAVPLMLKAGAAVLVEAQRAEVDVLVREAKIRKDASQTRSYGDLQKSIKATQPKSSSVEAYIEVYPQGKDRDGTDNAEKGFVLEFGRTNMPAYPWMATANEKSHDKVHANMLEVWEGLNNGE